MKIQLDTDNKIIKLEQDVNLGEFYDLLPHLLPNDLWREFKLEMQIINNFNSPIIIKEYIPSNPLFPLSPTVPTYPTYPKYPYYPSFPWITCDNSGINNDTIPPTTGEKVYKLAPGKFNIEA